MARALEGVGGRSSGVDARTHMLVIGLGELENDLSLLVLASSRNH
jgi:hypothetical protein